MDTYPFVFLDHPTYDAHKVDDSAVVNPHWSQKQAQKKAARDAARAAYGFPPTSSSSSSSSSSTSRNRR